MVFRHHHFLLFFFNNCFVICFINSSIVITISLILYETLYCIQVNSKSFQCNFVVVVVAFNFNVNVSLPNHMRDFMLFIAKFIVIVFFCEFESQFLCVFHSFLCSQNNGILIFLKSVVGRRIWRLKEVILIL